MYRLKTKVYGEVFADEEFESELEARNYEAGLLNAISHFVEPAEVESSLTEESTACKVTIACGQRAIREKEFPTKETGYAFADGVVVGMILRRDLQEDLTVVILEQGTDEENTDGK